MSNPPWMACFWHVGERAQFSHPILQHQAARPPPNQNAQPTGLSGQISSQGTFESMIFLFAKMGYVSSLNGIWNNITLFQHLCRKPPSTRCAVTRCYKSFSDPKPVGTRIGPHPPLQHEDLHISPSPVQVIFVYGRSHDNSSRRTGQQVHDPVSSKILIINVLISSP